MPSTYGLCRTVLSDRTNSSISVKRSRSEDGHKADKRPRTEKEEDYIVPISHISKRPHIIYTNTTAFRALKLASLRSKHGVRTPSVSSRPILESFVSSHKSDVYNIYNKDDITMPGLPFCCAFANEAKKGNNPILAIGTQDGVAEILNVSRREDWQPEPQRTVLQIHDNAILDIKWSKDDRFLATASGDATVRITSPSSHKTVVTLSRHTSSVKTLDWHPHHPDILCSGGRDGHIYLWDIRCSSKNTGEYGHTLEPVIQLMRAHEDQRPPNKNTSKTVTSVLYLPQSPQYLVSANSFDSKLRGWDMRYPRQGKSVMTFRTESDPTLIRGVRGRGISCLTLGNHCTKGSIWGIAADSCIYKFNETLQAEKPSEIPLGHSNLFAKSFYVKIATSPCGEWLASGSSGGGVYMWDIGSRSYGAPKRAVELKVTAKEVGAIDWSLDTLAACCDDGVIRMWRSNLEIAMECRKDPIEKKWEWAWVTESSVTQPPH